MYFTRPKTPPTVLSNYTKPPQRCGAPVPQATLARLPLDHRDPRLDRDDADSLAYSESAPATRRSELTARDAPLTPQATPGGTPRARDGLGRTNVAHGCGKRVVQVSVLRLTQDDFESY